jgi:hypothetical protein
VALRPLWIASQGLTIGLTPIYRAIQGLWPEDEEEETPPLIVFGGGGGGGRARSASRALDRHRAEQERIRRHNEDMMALILAAVAEEVCT